MLIVFWMHSSRLFTVWTPLALSITPLWSNQITSSKKLDDLIPKNFKIGSKYKRTGKAGIFAGSLELVKEGNLKIKQENLFEDIYVKENKWLKKN